MIKKEGLNSAKHCFDDRSITSDHRKQRGRVANTLTFPSIHRRDTSSYRKSPTHGCRAGKGWVLRWPGCSTYKSQNRRHGCLEDDGCRRVRRVESSSLRSRRRCRGTGHEARHRCIVPNKEKRSEGKRMCIHSVKTSKQ